jgi:acyl-coenzyme A synthetase/AMP-(fatty) acid ligase
MGLERARTLVRASGCPVIDLDNAVEGALPLSTLLLPYDGTWGDAEISQAAKRPFRSVLFTSGTSGDPKPVMRHRSIDARRFTYFSQRYGFNSQDRYLVTIPLYHVAGGGWARHFMSLGATLYLGPVNQPDVLSDMIVKHNITATVTTPINLAGIISALLANGNEREHALRFVLVGGKNFSPTQKQHAIKTLGPVVYEYYGSTETGVNTIAEPEDLLQHPKSVGRPYSGNHVVVVDDQARIVPPRAAGQVAVSSYLMMDHYADGSANEIYIDGERFIVTPDRGYLDESGRLYVFNRSSGKDGDFDVYMVEDQLRYFTGIKDVAIMMDSGGQASERRTGDCALVLEPGRDDDCKVIEVARRVLENAGIQHRRVSVVPRIPYNLSGKVRWNELDLMLSANAASFQLAA